MINFCKVLFACLLIVFSNVAQAQSDLLSEIPKTKKEFKQSEGNFLASMSWIENTPLNKDESKHKEQYMFITAWLINSPTVTLEINADMIDFSKKNSELIIFFMGGWGRYALENNYSEDAVQGNLAGLRTCMKLYKTKQLKKDKFLIKLIALEDKGELENWVKAEIDKQ